MVLAFTVKCLFHQKLRRSDQSIAVVAICTNFPFQIWMTGQTLWIQIDTMYLYR